MAEHEVIVIAHRGASGYLPEHTLEAKAYAHALGAHYLEQDVVATRDDQLVVLHDIHLDRVTDVVTKYPGRHRKDGRYYARDFDLDEIRTLRAWERRTDDGVSAVFAQRFPTGTGHFRVPTLPEEIAFIQGLNRATGRRTGIYPEIKRPAWHRSEGVDITPLVLQVLESSGYKSRSDPVFLQCFDASELHRIRHELGSELKLIQLLADNSWGESDTNYQALMTEAGLVELARTADGIGPWLGQLLVAGETDQRPRSSGLAAAAHRAGLLVHPYTFRADQLLPGFDSMGEMVAWCAGELAIDGVFTDFPDLALNALHAYRQSDNKP